MTPTAQAVLMAGYNEWMNVRLYAAAGRLAPADFAADRGAFFGSVCGTLNHIAVADTIWLRRFAGHPDAGPVLDPVRRLPAPAALDEILFSDHAALAAHRRMLDTLIQDWAATLTDAALDATLRYSNMRGQPFERPLGALVLHFFNHQTHHRGQATTLLSQLGQDVGVTDLLVLVPNHAAG